MKKLVGLTLCLLLSMSAYATTHKTARLSKKDRQDLIGLVSDPIARIEKLLDGLAQQIQNLILGANNDDSKECCDKLFAKLEEIEALSAKLSQALASESEALGSLDDESVGEEDFNSVSDIDDAELSVIAWLKSIYREQLKDKFVS